MDQAFVPVRCAGSRRVLTGRFVRDGQAWNLVELLVSGDGPLPPQRHLDRLRGDFGIALGYKGCPDCGRKSYVRCGRCGELACWAGTGAFHCVSCDLRGQVSDGIHEVNVENYS
jgi:hypothetical protein